ncbi:hypothetical protein EVJ58_g7681 [Rhodofomes roseus]|uniref:Uncharacterized protein n=1 Tax=Rhodofomes roseus TaxID=34475 RepID=A0A4Y9Y1Y3_9APHY|nr:hypothetical protein EVJ58_g7681 [Rhodofomes roseus]
MKGVLSVFLLFFCAGALSLPHDEHAIAMKGRESTSDTSLEPGRPKFFDTYFKE